MECHGIQYALIDSTRYKYRLTEQYALPMQWLDVDVRIDYIVARDQTLTIQRGYAWDGATCARDTRTNMRAALVHDALYQLIRVGRLPRRYRARADREYYRLCRRDGMTILRAASHYAAIRAIGGRFI
jgi:hypothetical protein